MAQSTNGTGSRANPLLLAANDSSDLLHLLRSGKIFHSGFGSNQKVGSVVTKEMPNSA